MVMKHEQLNQRIRESPDLLAGIVGSAMEAIIAIDDAHRIVLFNAAAEEMFACPANEAIGSFIERFIPQRFRDGHSTRVRRFDESGVTNRALLGLGTLWGLRAIGEEFPMEASISKVESGGKKFFTAVIRDISERHRAEEALRESEKRFRLVADTAPVLMWMSGTDTLCTYFNKPWLEFTGRSIEEELGNGWAEGVHPQDLQRCLQTYMRFFDLREEFRMEYRLRRHDGEYRCILDIGVPRFDQDRLFVGYIGIGVDVTERRRAEEARIRNAAIVESSDDAIIGTDLSGTVTDWNKGAERLFGYFASEAIAKNIFFLAPMDHLDEAQHIFKKVINGVVVRHHETVRQRKDGTHVEISLTVSPIVDAEGRVVGVSGIARDITERKQAEEALSRMTRKLVEAQEQERARIARELHDDVTQRLAMLAIEIEQVEELRPETSTEVRDWAHELSKRAKEISADVQLLSHELHSSRLEYLGIVGGMKSWCNEFGERQGIEIEFNPDVRSSVSAEISLCLFRVLQEALHNAVEHSGVQRVDVQLREESGEMRLTVSDLGKGFDVAAAMHERGLGITSMQERVRLVGGRIVIDSKPLGGTTVDVRVPLGTERSFQRVAG